VWLFPLISTPRGTQMTEKTIEVLRAEREPLFQQFTENPSQIDLAIKIKIIDDQIAECNDDIQKKKKTQSWLTK
jgi:hypothetical protein